MRIRKKHFHHHHNTHTSHHGKRKKNHIKPSTLVAQAHDPFLYAMFGQLEPYYAKMQELFNRFMNLFITQDLPSSCAQAIGTVIPWCLCPASCFSGFVTNIAKQVLLGQQ